MYRSYGAAPTDENKVDVLKKQVNQVSKTLIRKYVISVANPVIQFKA